MLCRAACFAVHNISYYFVHARCHSKYKKIIPGPSWAQLGSSAQISSSAASRSASSAAQRCTVPCRAVRYWEVLCSAVLRALCLLFRTCQVSFEASYLVPGIGTTTPTRFARTLLNHNNVHSQLSSARLKLSSAAQHRAVPCVGAALCRAALCIISNIQQYYLVSCEVTPVCACVLVLLLSFLLIKQWYSRSLPVAGRYGGKKQIGAVSSSVCKY